MDDNKTLEIPGYRTLVFSDGTKLADEQGCILIAAEDCFNPKNLYGYGQ